MRERIVGMLGLLCLLAGCSDATESDGETQGPYQGQKVQAGPPTHTVGGFSIALPEITLQPGEEIFPCWVFPLAVEGPSRVVGAGRLDTTAGLHHGNVTTRPATGEGFRECESVMEGEGGLGGEGQDILDGGAVLFASSTQIEGTEWSSFPEGMGIPISEGHEIVARMHYLNTSSEPVTLAPSYEWFTVDEATVEHLLGPFAWSYNGFEIPPMSEHSVTASCNTPGDMHIVNALPHMHALGTAFTAGYKGGERDGELFLDSVGYDPDEGVLTQYVPAIDLSQGEGATFSCTWNNTHDKTIVSGVGDNEMCILFGYAYPYEHAYSAIANDGGCVMIAPPPPWE